VATFALAAGICVLVVRLLEDYLIVPRVLGDAVGLSPCSTGLGHAVGILFGGFAVVSRAARRGPRNCSGRGRARCRPRGRRADCALPTNTPRRRTKAYASAETIAASRSPRRKGLIRCATGSRERVSSLGGEMSADDRRSRARRSPAAQPGRPKRPARGSYRWRSVAGQLAVTDRLVAGPLRRSLAGP